MSGNTSQWMPRRRPRQNDSVPPHTEIRNMRRRVTSGGSVIRQNQRIFSGDSTTDLGDFSMGSHLHGNADIFVAEDLVLKQPSRIVEELPNVVVTKRNPWEILQELSPDERDEAVTAFNKQTMETFDESEWLFQ